MAITYPLSFPSTPGPSQQSWSLDSSVGYLESPFTLATQVQEHSGQRWRVDVSLPSMPPSTAGAWRAFLAQLRGVRGTFLMGDISRKTPQGTAQYQLENHFTYSEEFDQWTASNASVSANATTDPLAATSVADELVEDATASTTHYVSRSNGSTVSSTQYRFLLYAKGNTRDWIRMDMGSGGFGADPGAYFDVTNGTVGTQGADIDSATIEDVGSGWYRCTVTATSDASAINTPIIYLADADGSNSYNGDGSSSVYLFGAQFQLAASSTRYVKTEGTSSQLMAPLVNGASQTGNELITDGWATNQTAILKAGDWIQLGTGANSELYMVVVDADSNTGGNSTLTIVPELRTSPSNNATITYQNTKGVFRLANNETSLFSITLPNISNMGFSAVEAL